MPPATTLRGRFAAPLLVILALSIAPVYAQQQVSIGSEFDLVFSGGIQPRASVGIEDAGGSDAIRYGVGLRRARFQARALYRDVAGVEYDVEGGSGTVQSVDLFAFANLTERVQARIGYFLSAQPRGAVLTPYFLIDAVDRAAIAEQWMGRTLGGDGRDFGIDVTYTGERTQLALWLHNGTGTFDRSVGNYSEGISSPSIVNGPETSGFAVTAAASFEAGGGIEVGAFGGFNGAESARTVRAAEAGRSYVTGGAHVYWGAVPGSQPVRLKLDALGIRYEDDGAGAQETVGVSALGAVRVLNAGEVFARGERFWVDLDGEGDNYLTAGMSYSPSAARGGPYQRVRLTLAYQLRDGSTLPDAHLVILQGQFVF